MADVIVIALAGSFLFLVIVIGVLDMMAVIVRFAQGSDDD